MGVLKKVVGNLIFLGTIGLSTFYLMDAILHKETVVFTSISNQMVLLPGTSENPVYSEISRNVYKCDLVTVSNIVTNMTQAGYVVKQCSNSEMFLDIILQKEEEKYRLYYSKERILISIAYVYEDSYIPFTYISEEE